MKFIAGTICGFLLFLLIAVIISPRQEDLEETFSLMN